MRVEPHDEASSPFFRLVESERKAILFECRRSLTIQQRLILVWRYEREMKITSIAEILHVSPDVVRKALKRAILPRLRRELEARGITHPRDLL